MQFPALQPFVIILVVLLAGCTGGGPTDTPTDSHNIPYEIAVVNEDKQTHSLSIVIRNGTKALYNDTLTVPVQEDPNELETRDLTFSEQGTFTVEARLGTGATATMGYEVNNADPDAAIFISIENGTLEMVTYYW